jgi:predicted aspartyl protease
VEQDNNPQGGNTVGRIKTEIVVSNNQDVQMAKGGALPPEQIRRFQLEGTVDTGSTQLVLPEDVVNRLGLPRAGEATIRYADRRTVTRPVVDQVQVELLGRRGTFRAIVEPNRTTALIGAIVLEDLDFLADCANQRLVPRDPNRPIYEVE